MKRIKKMKNTNTKNRIIFLDILRAFAVVNMIQGHTVDVTLAPYYRNSESLFYFIWNFNRGITAPIFLFTAWSGKRPCPLQVQEYSE